MKKLSDQAVFFGSGLVAARSLDLLNQWINIELVITKRKPPHHKEPAPVEELAINKGIMLLYADNKAELDNIIDQFRPKSKIGIVIDYGVIISEKTINYFEKGIINSHFSLLPQWRGADPITYSLLSGQSETGITIMRIDSGLDTGDIIASKSLEITASETSTTLTSKLIELSNNQLKTSLPLYIGGEIIPQPQSLTKIATYSRKLTKTDGLINTNKPATVLEREIRAFSEWPKSRLEYKSLWITVTNAQVSQQIIKPGLLEVKDGKLLLGCKNGSLQINELQPAGKNKMNDTAFINGYSHLLK